jgi:hypothetical protein
MALSVGLHRIEQLLAISGLDANIRAFNWLTLCVLDAALNGRWSSPDARNGEEQPYKPDLQ